MAARKMYEIYTGDLFYEWKHSMDTGNFQRAQDIKDETNARAAARVMGARDVLAEIVDDLESTAHAYDDWCKQFNVNQMEEA